MEIEIHYQPKQRQAKELLNSGVKRLGYGGARGGGKSKFIRNYLVENLSANKNLCALIVRKKYGDLQRNYIDKFKKEFPFLEYKALLHRELLPNGAFIDLRYLQFDKDLEDFQGAEYDIIALDEATQHGQNVYDKLRPCLRTTTPNWQPKFILTCNPGGIGHNWFHQLFVKPGLEGKLPKDMAFVQATVDDNRYVNEDYKKELDELPDKLRRAWRYGDWAVFEGMFFPEFGTHLKEQPYNIPAHICNLYGSLDYGDGQGERSGATSFGLWHVDTEGKPHRLFTYYKKHQTASVYAREILASIQSFSYTSGVMPKEIIADPSIFFKRMVDDVNTKSIADIFGEYGLKLTPAINDRVMGWRVMREYFTRDECDLPRSFYWDGYNNEYEQYIPTLIHSETNPNDCEKGGEDHVGDEARYGLVRFMNMRSKGIAAQTATLKRANVNINQAFNRMLSNKQIEVVSG